MAPTEESKRKSPFPQALGSVLDLSSMCQFCVPPSHWSHCIVSFYVDLVIVMDYYLWRLCQQRSFLANVHNNLTSQINSVLFCFLLQYICITNVPM